MELQVGVKILLRDNDGKFLIVRRSAKKYPEVGSRWDIVGGRIIVGEPLLKNLRREIKEEVGLVYTGEPRLVAAQDILRIPGRHVVRLTYVGDMSGDPVLDEDHDEFRWVTHEEFATTEPMDIYVKELLAQNYL